MDLSRRAVMAGAACGLIGSAASAAGLDAGPARPNILWLVSEDNNPYVGAYGDKLAHTPTIDALARDGVLYRNAFSNAPVCATSRFGILTGVYPESCSPAQHMRANAHLPKELKTYPEYLREAGYYCANNWKTDYNCDVDPKKIWDDSSPTAQWYHRPEGMPFMAVYNYFTTHESQIFFKTEGRVKPADVRVPAYLPDTPDVRTDIASYYNLMEKLDGQLAQRLDQLKEKGVADDTIIFYYSDNGGVLPRSKHYDYDEGFRTCFIIYVPPKWRYLALAQPGSVVETPVSYIDLVPTLLSLIGQKKPEHMPGRALVGRFAGSPEHLAFGARDRMDERYDFCRTACDGRYRYIRNYTPDRPWGVHEAFAWQAKSYQDWERRHLAGDLNQQQDRFFHSKPYEEFYDLHADQDEVHNLIDDPEQAARVAAMRAALDRHMLAINDNGFIPEGAPGEGYFESRNRAVYPLERLMALAGAAARRKPSNLAILRQALTDTNVLVRYWATAGLRMLGRDAMPVKDDLMHLVTEEASLHIQVVAAETIAELGEVKAAVDRLVAILDMKDQPFPVRLQALNSLTFIGEPARAGLPAIRRAAEEDQEYMRDAGRYLVAVLDGTYKPETQIFDVDWFRRKTGFPAVMSMPPPPL